MNKELVISIIIILVILVGNQITQQYTGQTVDSMQHALSKLRQEINKEETDTVNIDIALQNVSNDWEKRKDKLAYYLEHDEIEKVEIHLTKLQSHIDVEDWEEGINDLDSCSFVLGHLQDKQSFNLKNIF